MAILCNPGNPGNPGNPVQSHYSFNTSLSVLYPEALARRLTPDFKHCMAFPVVVLYLINVIDVYDGRPVYPYKPGRVQMRLKILHGFFFQEL